MKRIYLVALLFSLALFMHAYDFSVVTQSQYPCELYYAINEDGNSVTLVQGSQAYQCEVVDIPATVTYGGKTYNVTSIGSYAFRDSQTPRVNMANSIVEIQNYAFWQSSVTQVDFSQNLKRIDNGAFRGSKLKGAKLYEGIEEIGPYAFCSQQLDTINLPTTLNTLGKYALQGTRIRHITIPEGITVIPEQLFASCSYLQTVSLPVNMRSIEPLAFYGCSSLTEIHLPNSLESIGRECFRSCKALQEIVVPNSVVSMGTGIFQYCTNLQEVVFSLGMDNIPDETFGYCQQLYSIEIPESVKSIGEACFWHCERLTSIALPDGIEKLGKRAFSEAGLTKFTFPSALSAIGERAFEHCAFTEITIPSTVTTLQPGCFGYCESLQKVVLPETVTAIPSSAFLDCSSLKEINIHDGVSTIGESAFAGCESLLNVTFPRKLSSIGRYAFRDCSGLKEVTLYSDLAKIGDLSFWKCSGLSAFHMQRAIPPSITYASNITGVMETDNACTLYVPTGSKATYEDTKGWNVFNVIEEENVDGTIYYQVKTSVASGNGKVLVNGESKSPYAYEVPMKSDVIITLQPASEYQFLSLSCNGKDVTNEVSDATYVISGIAENNVLEASFKPLPVWLSIKMGDGGKMEAPVEKGDTFVCHIVPETGWSVNSVRFNNKDVTASVEDGTYTTPKLTANAALSISFESVSVVEGIAMGSNTRAYVSTDGVLTLEGLPLLRNFEIVASDGTVIRSQKATDHTCCFKLPRHDVYIVRTVDKTIKVCY